jgi:hypothetical protein
MKEIIFSKIAFEQFLWFLATPFVWLLSNKKKESMLKWGGKSEASFKDFISLLRINISINNQKIFVKKNAGILTPYDVPEINSWVDDWEGDISNIKNISLESDVYLMNPYWEEKDSDDVFMPRFIFINLKNDQKILAAVFYDRKLAKKIASKIERKLSTQS